MKCGRSAERSGRYAFFVAVALEDIDRIVAHFSKVSCSKGSKVIKEGQPGAALYVIKSGRCVVTKKGWFGKEQIRRVSEEHTEIS